MTSVDHLSPASFSSWIIVLLTGVGALYFLLFRKSRAAKMLENVPGPPSLPFFGNALELNVPNECLLPLLIRWCHEYGFIYHIMVGFNHYLIMSNSTPIEKVLSSQVHIEKSRDYDFLMPWLGTGLLTSKGQKWFQRRKMLTPAFHFKILDDFLVVINEQSQILVEVLKTEFSDGQVFDVFPYITRCALDIICETAFGKTINAQREKDSDYVKAIYRISELLQHRQVRPWLHPNFIWKRSPSGREEKKLLDILHGFTTKVIKERKAEKLQESQKKTNENKTVIPEDDIYMKGKRRLAFLDLLLEAQEQEGNNLTDLDIREETDTFMFEGHDTTAANANWTTFLLASHPQYQAKVHEEMDDIFENDKERAITSQDLAKMKYLELCIKESLRLYPSVPFIARSINSDLPIDDKVTVPAGTTAFIVPYQLHRDANVFPEPEIFLPDRFLPENTMGRSPYAYVPFSAGPRNCIGQKFAIMEEKVLLANIFRNFKVQAGERREDVVLLAELILRPKNGLKIKITPRN